MRSRQKKSSEKMARNISRYNFRKYRQTNWEVYFDTSYDKMQARQRPTVPYGLKTHNFRRIITSKIIKNKMMYLMEWENFELSEATWEPQSILPKHIDSLYYRPEVSYEALVVVARQFESAIQRCLARRIKETSTDCTQSFCVNFPLDMFRYVFGSSDPGRQYNISNIDSFSKLPMCSGWWYYIDKQYTRSQLSFPVCVEPRLTMRKVFKNINGKFEWRKQPVEKVRVTLSFLKLESFTKSDVTPKVMD
ncbi:uncharacterized protein LOC132554144 [Ylistrum balloti]|uniref:uncharacterized protein LOC132554144 n=1 Tax=Ylistrum balloti TaxID=509963 RepID=UPI002905ADD7|nr:uncharacterized protein LOC132554144 [Ylistrum balloti]